MKRLTAAAIILLGSACGGGGGNTDYGANFAGIWIGNGTTTMGSASSTQRVAQSVTVMSANHLRYDDPSCPIYGTSDSATHASIDNFSCPSVSGPCSFTMTGSGNFVLDGTGGRLTLGGTATFGSGCALPQGSTVPYSYATDLMTRARGM